MARRPISLDGSDAGKNAMTLHHRFLLVATQGSGKTCAMVRAAADIDLPYDDIAFGRATPVGDPTVFYACVGEPQGLANVKLINPKAKAEYIETEEDLGSLLMDIRGGMLTKLGCTRLALDGITQGQRLLKDSIVEEVMESNPGMRANWFDRDDWSYLNERTRRLLMLVNSLPCDVIMSAHEVENPEARTAAARLLPKLEGNASKVEIGGYCTAVGRASRMIARDSSGHESITYGVLFSAPYLVKGVGPITGWQKPCAAAWLDVLHGRAPAGSTALPRPGSLDPEPELTARAAAQAPQEAAQAPAQTRSARRPEA